MPDDENIITIHKADDTEFKADLDRLAKRLGVEPSAGNRFDFSIASDGKLYSVTGLCHAFLNRMDASDKQFDRLLEAVALCVGNAMPVSFEGQPRVSIRRDLFDELVDAFNEFRSHRAMVKAEKEQGND